MKYFDKKNNRLVFKQKKSSPDYWDNHWKTDDFKKEVFRGLKEKMIIGTTKKYLKPEKSTNILEGGCGRGQLVYALEKNGYSAYGVDYADETIKKVNTLFPELRIYPGDVRKLDFPDNFFDGYWSRGVIEHFFDGYNEIIKEISRVIKTDGYVFITFPYFSPYRKFKAKLGKYKEFRNNEFNKENFYQFFLDSKKVIKDFENSGFTLVYEKPFNSFKGIKEESSFLKPLMSKIGTSGNKFCIIIKKTVSVLTFWFAGHSILLVFKKINK